jgi:glycosyltransferase involved in cell wall biosynthesis
VTDVSVLTPAYGYGRFLEDCIDSVIGQDTVRTQHVIQDGGSKDETLDVLRSFGDRVQWTSEPDRGQSDALNKALMTATGDWVGWLNADEYYLPGGLGNLVQEAEKHRADIVYGDIITVDHDGKMLGLSASHPFSPTVLRLYGPFTASVSLIIRRSMLDEDPWDPTLNVIMDWELYLGLLSKGAKFHHLAYPVGAFRVHQDQMSSRPGQGDTTRVRDRYGIPTTRWSRSYGRFLHRLRKLATGSYIRELRARPLRERDTRWFREDVGRESFNTLLARCYWKDPS